jgi:hypothetical protein
MKMPSFNTIDKPKKKKMKFLIRVKEKVAAAAPPMTAIGRVLEFAGAIDDPALRAHYDGITGLDCPLDELVSSDVVQSEALADGLAAGVGRHRLDQPGVVAVQTQHLAVTPGSAPEFDIPAIRKMGPKKGSDAISAIDLFPIPDALDPFGFAIEIVMRTIHFGPNVPFGPSGRIHNTGTKAFPEAGPVSSARPTTMDEAELRVAIKRLVEPRLTVPPGEESNNGLFYPDDWNDGRALRAWVMLQVWSMLPIKKRLMAMDTGRAILTGELAHAEDRLSRACKRHPCPIHRDGVPHFWFGEARRLDLRGLSVPLIKFH